jgi:hypothetical protein
MHSAAQILHKGMVQNIAYIVQGLFDLESYIDYIFSKNVQLRKMAS